MNRDLDILLDKCIDRMNQGDSLEECLASYPEQAEELEPLLRAIWSARNACSSIPSATAKSATRRRLDAALVDAERRHPERQRRTASLFAWPRVLATVAAVLVLALMGFGLHWLLTPETAPVFAQANFRLLLSDQENAIGDFESLEVTITGIGMLRAGEPGGWEKIELEESVVRDLTRLQGLNAQEIWGGTIPEGQYTHLFIYIEDATGTLKSGETVNVVIPSGNLQISKPFVVGADGSVVNFVYDVTVISAGDRYILLPQIDQSGPEQEFHEVGEGKLTLRVVDPEPPTPVTPGDNITVLVTFQGDPMPGAQVRVNGVDIGNTSGEAGEEGRISFTVPYDKKLKVKAEITTELGELEGQLKVEFGEELNIEVIEGEVTPGGNITIMVTFQGNLVEGAQVRVKDVGVFLTDAEGRTLPFTVPYDDELKIKAQKDKLKGELEIGLEEKFEEAELNIEVVEGEVTPGGNITIMVTFQENPVEGALVKVKDVGVFLTDAEGRTLPFTVPYDDELKIKAQKDKLKGELEIDLEEKFEEAELNIEVVEGEVTPGGNITIMVTFQENPVEGALVKVKDAGAFITDDAGRSSFTVPYDDELEIKVKKGKLKGELEIDLEQELPEGEAKIEAEEEPEGEFELEIEKGKEKLKEELETEQEEGEAEVESHEEPEGKLTLDIEGDVAPGETVTLMVTFADEPVAGAKVKLNDETIGSTKQDGTITFTTHADADELEIKVKKEKLKGELQIEQAEE